MTDISADAQAIQRVIDEMKKEIKIKRRILQGSLDDRAILVYFEDASHLVFAIYWLSDYMERKGVCK